MPLLNTVKHVDSPPAAGPSCPEGPPSTPTSGPTGPTFVVVDAKPPKRSPMIEADRLFNRAWCMEERHLKTLVAARGEMAATIKVWYDDDDDDEDDDKPGYMMSSDGIAFISVKGPLTKGYYWRGTSYGDVVKQAAHAYTNSDVKAVLFVYDSPGGEASGMFECSDALYALRGLKPTAAISDDQAYSAAYALASTASRLFVTITGGTGSIGCWTAHVDYSEMLKSEGIKVTFIFAGAKKVDGNPYEPLSSRAEKDMQTEVDRIRDLFVAAVARNRGASADALYATEAGCYMADAGIPLLADAVGTIEDATAYLRARIAALDGALAEEPGDKEEDGAALAAKAESFVAERVHSGVFTLRGALLGDRCGVEFAMSKEASQRIFEVDEAILAMRRFAGSSASVSTADRKVTLLAIPYDSSLSSDLGGFREQYEPGCFSGGLGNDPRFLFNHDDACVIGRKSAGTAMFWEDAEGVHSSADAPQTTWADDMLVSMRRKDLTQGSASFWILKHRWETRGNERVRIVEKALLRDTDICAFAAYESTTASVQPAASEESHVVTELDRARLELLKLR